MDWDFLFEQLDHQMIDMSDKWPSKIMNLDLGACFVFVVNRCQVTSLFLDGIIRQTNTSYFQQIKCHTIGMLDWDVLPLIVKEGPCLLQFP